MINPPGYSFGVSNRSGNYYFQNHILMTISRTKCVLLVSALIILSGRSLCAQTLHTVPDDPMNTQIYTLDNGLKVYLSVNKEKPRIETRIAVRVGGKNDPAETTGLAHYFEHIMFKGTKKFGTSDYAKELPLLDRIEELYEKHRATTDEAEKKKIYRKIDSISYEASKYAIPNEYDKLMSAIGSQGTNAYTSYDETVYVEDIPSNQIENWAKIQADRFENTVIRGFHTELEAVYEEKNISLSKDSRKVYETILQALFPTHPYGTQTVLGTQYDLKNPSIKNIKAYYEKYYVPNNMAICMAGDLDPQKTIKIIQRYFGHLKPNLDLKQRKIPEVKFPTEIIEKTVYGNEAENLMIGWCIPPKSQKEGEIVLLLRSILSNGKTGLFDTNLLLEQKVLYAASSTFGLEDYDAFCLIGYPKPGQSLDELKALLLEQLDKVKAGDFDESLLCATINNIKKDFMKGLESNESRVNSFVSSFISGMPWEYSVHLIDRLSHLTKKDIVNFANRYLSNNYAVVYKEKGEDKNIVRMEKPAITPLVLNRDKVSDFLTEVVNAPVQPIEPVFVDYAKAIQVTHSSLAKREILYTANKINDIFSLTYLFEPGVVQEKSSLLIPYYLEVIGSTTRSAQDIKKAFYDIACDYKVSINGRRPSITITGLQENMDAAIRLVDEIFLRAKGDESLFARLKESILAEREVELSNQDALFSALGEYVIRGAEFVKSKTVSDAELSRISSSDVVEKIHSLMLYPHRVLYYGPAELSSVEKSLATHHPKASRELPTPTEKVYPLVTTGSTKVFFAEYDAPNFNMIMYNNMGLKYDVSLSSIIEVYNGYFGGGMNSIVFQELREARGLAYSASSYVSSPSQAGFSYRISSNIASQNDKMKQAIETFSGILTQMPESNRAFEIAKEGILAGMRSERVHPSEYAFKYIRMQDMGLKTDPRETIFKKVQGYTLKDVVTFQKSYIKGRTYHYGVLGSSQNLDMEYLKSIAPITKVGLREIFGY